MKDKKRIAAIAAVMQYLKSEEEALMQPVAAEAAAEAPAPAGRIAGLWGLAGRQQQMQLGTLMQLRSLSWR